jgi:drug/metabolite transporter (DMT)-like permease
MPQLLPGSDARRASTLGLYALIVWCWGTSWYALHHQLGVVAPEVSLVWRFGLAASVMFFWCAVIGAPLAYPLTVHVRFAALGVTLFSTNFLLFYHGGQHVASGLLAVVFSTASLFNLIFSAVFLGQRIERNVAFGAIIGFSGIAMIYWPEINRLPAGGADGTAWIGLASCIGGTISFCIGNMISAANQRLGLPIKSASAWGMLYGTAFLGLLAVLQGRAFIIEWSTAYVSSLLYLVLFSTVLAFAAYLTLLGRIGAARAGYATVLFPVLALLISTFLEDYQWTLSAFAGLAMVAIGNVIVLQRQGRGATQGVTAKLPV